MIAVQKTGHISGKADVFLFVIFDSRFDRVLGQNRAMDLNWWQSQFFSDLSVFDRQRLIKGFAFHPFSH